MGPCFACGLFWCYDEFYKDSELGAHARGPAVQWAPDTRMAASASAPELGTGLLPTRGFGSDVSASKVSKAILDDSHVGGCQNSPLLGLWNTKILTTTHV